MIDLLINPKTSKQIKQVIKDAPHAILLSGNNGSGKRTIALYISEQILNHKLDSYPYFSHVKPEKNTLTINQIRELKEFTKLKTTGKNRIRRIVLLENAHLMNLEAQNALLKILEEPPEDTLIILTVIGRQSLKPTIYSRTQQLFIKPVSKQDAFEYATSINKAGLHDRCFSLSQGDAGLYVALLQNDNTHPLAAAIINAKQLLTTEPYLRLIRIDEITKDKNSLTTLMFAMKRIAAAALDNAITKNDLKLQDRWLLALHNIHSTEEKNLTNANSKLLLTDLFLGL